MKKTNFCFIGRLAFIPFWLFLGGLQFFFLQGCTENQVTAGSSKEKTYNQAISGEEPSSPIWVSRAFFEKPIVGSIQAQAQDAEPITVIAQTTWDVMPPTSPLPTGEIVYADFRDRIGCAFFDLKDKPAICFHIMPDVSSIELSREKVKAFGMEDIIQRALAQEQDQSQNCAPQLHLLKAKVQGDSIVLHFVSESIQAPVTQDATTEQEGLPEECLPLKPVDLEITLTQAG